MKTGSHKVWISLANVISCIAVIFLHCNGVFWRLPSGRLWYTSNLIETLFYWAVPVFFMISGATLLDYRERYNTKVYFRKRFSRTLFPFIVWSFIGSLYWYLFWQNKWGGWKDFISGFFTSRYCAPYWYFFPLFSTYLSIPVLSAIDKDKRISIFKAAVFAQIILVSVMPTLFQIMGITWNGDLYVGAASGYMLYVLLGYLISNTDIKKNQRMIIYLLGMAGFLLQYIGTNILSIRDGQINDLWHGYFRIPEILMSIAVFTACKYIYIYIFRENKQGYTVFIPL